MSAVFRPMLASPAEIDKLSFPLWASPKLDGVRCIVHPEGPMSRSMKVIPNRHVQKLLTRPQLVGLDGELCVGPYNDKNLMQATTSGVMSFDGEPNFKYYVFDYWNGQGEGFEERLKRLEEAFKGTQWMEDAAQHLVLLPQTKILNLEELNKFESICLEHGFEGIMTRKPDGAYKQGRSTAREQHLLKIKRFEDSEAVVIGMQEFMHNANELESDELGYAKRSSAKDGKVPMDTMGALLVRDLTTGIEFSIGTGFDMAQRKRLWDTRDSVMGLVLTYKHFANAGVKDAPRFPVFKSFRDKRDMG